MNRQLDGNENEDSRADSNRKVRSCRKDFPVNSTDKNDSCKDSPVLDWHPDYSLSSPQAREWHKQNEKSRHQPLDIKHGVYTVKHGDALSTVAARELKAEGKRPDKKSIAHEVKEIVALNHEKYPALECNTEYLEAGWNLKMPHHKTTKNHSSEKHLGKDDSRQSVAPDQPNHRQPGPPLDVSQPSQIQPVSPEHSHFQTVPAAPPVMERQGIPQFDQQSQFPMQILGQALRGLTGHAGNLGSPDYAQIPGDQATYRLAQDLLQGDIRDAIHVLRAEIGRGNGIGVIQQANRIAEHAAAQQGNRSPLRIDVERDGDVDIVDQFGRRLAQAGNVYGRRANDGWPQEQYLQQQQFMPQRPFMSPQFMPQQQFMQQQTPYASPSIWLQRSGLAKILG